MQQQPGMTTTQLQPSPISSRPTDEAAGGSSAPAGSFDHDGQSAAAGGDEGERSGSAGNRWPRQETLALLKIRSEMDAAFREAALKGPLWEEVSRKLADMGYKRSAKKCREKFENVDKYYKRTKDGRAGRGDGKAYRFFSELEALYHGGSAPPTPVAMAPPAFPQLVVPMHAEPPPPPPAVTMPPAAPTAPPAAAGATDAMITAGDVFSFSSSSDGEDTDETGGKRKRRGGDGGGSSSKMMRFFEGLMRQVMERQEHMQQRFIEAIERREQDRMIREEAWRRQEVARLAREQDALAQERAMAASRDAAVVSFIQRITGQTIPMPPASSTVVASPPTMISALKPTPVASAAPQQHGHQQQQQPPPSSVVVHQQLVPKPHASSTVTTQPQQPAESKDTVVVRAPPPPESQDTVVSGSPPPSRWPKAEVHALIQLRTELEARYPDAGPKGPLWEDISAGMRRLGYNRSAKRCKEKWENINKYFKKVKESNKKRPEDSKTCPYYHQLDAIYRSKALAGAAGGAAAPPHPRPEASAVTTVLAPVPLSQTAPQAVPSGGGNKQDCSTMGNGTGNGCASRGCSSDNGGMQTQASNGASNGTPANKQEDMMTKEMPQPVSMNDSNINDSMYEDGAAGDSDSMDDDDEDDFGDEEEEGDVGGGNSSKQLHHQYEIQFQRQQQNQSSVVVRPNASGGAGSGPGPATTSGSFLTMVHH